MRNETDWQWINLVTVLLDNNPMYQCLPSRHAQFCLINSDFCSLLTTPEGSHVQYERTAGVNGVTAVYRCVAGYDLQQGHTGRRTCNDQSEGRWTGPEQICERELNSWGYAHGPWFVAILNSSVKKVFPTSLDVGNTLKTCVTFVSAQQWPCLIPYHKTLECWGGATEWNIMQMTTF